MSTPTPTPAPPSQSPSPPLVRDRRPGAADPGSSTGLAPLAPEYSGRESTHRHEAGAGVRSGATPDRGDPSLLGRADEVDGRRPRRPDRQASRLRARGLALVEPLGIARPRRSARHALAGIGGIRCGTADRRVDRPGSGPGGDLRRTRPPPRPDDPRLPRVRASPGPRPRRVARRRRDGSPGPAPPVPRDGYLVDRPETDQGADAPYPMRDRPLADSPDLPGRARPQPDFLPLGLADRHEDRRFGSLRGGRRRFLGPSHRRPLAIRRIAPHEGRQRDRADRSRVATLELADLAAEWSVSVGPDGWSIDRLEATSPLGHLSAVVPDLVDASRPARIEGEVDLAAVARQLPKAFGLGAGTSIEAGTARLVAVSKPGGDRSEWTVDAKLADLSWAGQDGVRHREASPVSLSGRATYHPDGPPPRRRGTGPGDSLQGRSGPPAGSKVSTAR